jgi:hypothetical protein
VLQARRDADFASEPLCSHRRDELPPQDFYGNLAAVTKVKGPKDCCHATAADFT